MEQKLIYNEEISHKYEYIFVNMFILQFLKIKNTDTQTAFCKTQNT